MIKQKIPLTDYALWTGLWALCAYTGIKQELILIITALIFVDFITGIAASISVHQKIYSTRMARWIAAKSLSIVIPFIIALLGKILQVNLMPLVFGILSLFGVAEAHSIVWNIYEVYEWERVEEEDALKFMFKYILIYLNERLKSIYKNEEDDNFNS